MCRKGLGCGGTATLSSEEPLDVKYYLGGVATEMKDKEGDWISTKDSLPLERTLVKARNPLSEAISWIDGVNELGKPSWYHILGWEHADDFVTEWRSLRKEELNEYYNSLGIFVKEELEERE